MATSAETLTLSVEQVTRLHEALADTFPMNAEEREAWVDQCVLAELRGNLMQGLAHLGYHWFQRFTDSTTIFGAEVEVLRETPAMAVLDAHGTVGSLMAKKAMGFACEKAKRSGAAIVTIRNSPDWMMMGYSSRQALKYDCVGIAIANSRPEVAPWGGTTPVYGSNPFSIAIPTGRHYPILVDMTSSDWGGLTVQEQLILGQLPQGRFYGPDGKLATDPSLWGQNMTWGMKAGAIRMGGGYRDLALTVAVDALGGALSGMKTAMDLGVPEPVIDGNRTPRGQVVIAIDIDQFTPLDEFKAKVDRAIDQAKASPLAAGFAEILMPGERGYREEERRRREGIPVFRGVWDDVRRWSAERGVDADAVVGTPLSAARGS